MKKLTLYSELKIGDLIQIPIAASGEFKRDKIKVPEGAKPTFTYGYVSSKMFKSQQGDLPKIEVLEILPRGFAERGDAPHIPVIPNEAGSGFTINPNKQWSLVIRPIPLNPKSDDMAKEKISHVGSLTGTVTEQRLLDKVKTMRDPHLEGAPGMGSSGPIWGLYRPIGITRRNEADDLMVTGPKRAYRRKHDFVGQVVDMDLADAVKTVALPEDIAAMFSRSRGRGKRAITSFRKVWEMANKNPEELKEFIPETTGLSENPNLEELVDSEIDMAIVNGLSSPKKGMDVAPIVDLKAAYDLVSAPDADERMAKYMFMGPVNRALAKQEIPAAYEKRVVAQEKDPQVIASALKAAWKDFMAGFATFKQTDEIPERFRREDGTPVWKLVDLKP